MRNIATHMEYLLHTEKLCAGYDRKPVLHDISLSVRSGEILTLLGSNGAGKSTLLKTLICQLKPLGGAIFLHGKPVDTLTENEIARTVSIVMTDHIDAELLTVEDIVSSGRYPYTGKLGILSAHDKAVAEDAMRQMRIRDLRTCYFQQLSDGQRQKVLLTRAICQEPEILVMDEPTSFLDLRGQMELFSTLRDMVSRLGIAVILSTHELEFARKISTTVLCLRNGTADRIGTPEKILTPEYLEHLYDLPPGSYRALFLSVPDIAHNSTLPDVAPHGNTLPDGVPHYSFMQNRKCEMFPCHAGVNESDFNCLFCYCPLYALGEHCGGNFSYTEKGIKNCTDCHFPHVRENYKAVIGRFPELAQLARKRE